MMLLWRMRPCLDSSNARGRPGLHTSHVRHVMHSNLFDATCMMGATRHMLTHQKLTQGLLICSGKRAAFFSHRCQQEYLHLLQRGAPRTGACRMSAALLAGSGPHAARCPRLCTEWTLLASWCPAAPAGQSMRAAPYPCVQAKRLSSFNNCNRGHITHLCGLENLQGKALCDETQGCAMPYKK